MPRWSADRPIPYPHTPDSRRGTGGVFRGARGRGDEGTRERGSEGARERGSEGGEFAAICGSAADLRSFALSLSSVLLGPRMGTN